MKKFLIVLAMVVTASLLMGAGCFIVNTPPIITTTPGNTAIVGTEYTYTITATDPEGDPITYSLVSGPTDMIFDGVATISWTPTVEQVGVHDVTVEADDGEEGTIQNFTITVIPVSVAPTLTAIASPQIAYYGEVFTYTVVATAGTDPDLTFSLPVAPTMMSIVPATGVISWTPIADQLGYNDVTVKVTAADGLSDEVSFIVEVREPIPPEVELTSIAVLPEVMDLIVGDSETITLVTADYDDGSTAVIALGDCTYLSDDEEVATVLAGVVTAVAEGTATITVSYGDESDTIAVAVSEPEPEPVIELTGIVVDPKTMDLFVGGSEEIVSVTATYEIRGTEVPIALGDCNYESDDEEVATVEEVAGVVTVTAVAEGEATITVGYGDKTDTLAVTVSEFVLELVGIEVDPKEMVLPINTIGTLEVIAHYNDDTTPDVTLECDYGSSNNSIATVEAGKVTAVAEGTAIITVTYEGKTDAVEVTVGDFIAMEIIADLPTFTVEEEAEFTLGTVANSDVGKNVLAYFTLPDETEEFWYYEVNEIGGVPPGWKEIVDPGGIDVVFGPNPSPPPVLYGFPLGDVTTEFKATFSTAGTYPVLLEFWEVIEENGEKVELLGYKVITAEVID